DFVLGFDAVRQRQLLKPLGLDDLPPARLALVFAAAAALALAWMLWLTARTGRERDPVLRAWHRLGERYARRGLGRAPHEPAGAWSRRIGADLPDGGEALQRLILRFNNWRYAVGVGDAPEQAALARDLRRHRPVPPSRST